MKSWSFNDGSPPALQLEFEAPFAVADTGALRKLLPRVWMAFGPYVEEHGYKAAILTATNFKLHGIYGVASTSDRHSFGYVAVRDTAGVWRVKNTPAELPHVEQLAKPTIYLPNGSPLIQILDANDAAHEPAN